MVLIISMFELLNGCCMVCFLVAFIKYLDNIQRMHVEYNRGRRYQEREMQPVSPRNDPKQFKPFEGVGHHIDL